MKYNFYKDQLQKPANNADFKSEQSDFSDRAEIITEVQDQYKLYIDHYLLKGQDEGVDAPLFDFIDANGDQDKVITYIDFELENNPEDLSKDDLVQLENLKTVLKNQDYKEKMYIFPNNVNFGILGGKYINKDGSESKIVKQDVKKLRKNVYKLLIDKEGSKVTDKYDIHFDGSNYVSIYNQFGMRMGREEIKKGNTVLIEGNRYRKEQYQTEGELEIKSPSEKIDLDLLFVA